jgi:hypothetical protein
LLPHVPSHWRRSLVGSGSQLLGVDRKMINWRAIEDNVGLLTIYVYMYTVYIYSLYSIWYINIYIYILYDIYIYIFNIIYSIYIYILYDIYIYIEHMLCRQRATYLHDNAIIPVASLPTRNLLSHHSWIAKSLHRTRLFSAYFARQFPGSTTSFDSPRLRHSFRQ